MSNGPGGGHSSFQQGLARLKDIDPRSSAGRRIQAAFSRTPRPTVPPRRSRTYVSPEVGQAQRIGATPPSRASINAGKQLFELLSEDNKRRALEGTLPSGFFSSEQMRQLNAWIRSSGTTVESYFTEVETMSVREREVRQAVAGVGLRYDENLSVDENAQRAADVAIEVAKTGRLPLPQDTFSPEALKQPQAATVGDTEDDGETAEIEDIDAELSGPGYYGPGDFRPAPDDALTGLLGDVVSDGDGVVLGGVVPSETEADAVDADARDALQAEVEALLAEQFGGFSFFLQKHNSELQVGLTAGGEIVEADDPNAVSVKNVLDVIVEQGITAPTRVRGIIQKTEWWQTTDAKMREYDVFTADMSEPEKVEYLEPVLDLLREEAQFLGIQLDPTVARELAEDITRMGEENDSEYIRGALVAESDFNAAESVASGFATQRDRIVALSKQYFTPIDEAAAATYAEDIYIGTKTEADFEQMFREQAAAKYPQLQNALNANITPEQYFAPYKYEIEQMLDRPNIDLYEEFGDVIQYIPDTGTGEARPMTLGEVRKYVRGLDEWQQSPQAKESARALSFSIGKLFGEVA